MVIGQYGLTLYAGYFCWMLIFSTEVEGKKARAVFSKRN